MHTDAEIQAKLAELAAQIDADYDGKDLLLVGVLNGALMVMADLSRHHLPRENGLDGDLVLRVGRAELRAWCGS